MTLFTLLYNLGLVLLNITSQSLHVTSRHMKEWPLKTLGQCHLIWFHCFVFNLEQVFV